MTREIEKILDITPEEKKEKKTPVVINKDDTDDIDINSDFEEAKNNTLVALDMLKMTAEKVKDIAFESEDMKSFDVLNTTLRTLLDGSEKLMDIHRKKHDAIKRKRSVQEVNLKQENINIENAVFTGTTADLLKKLKKNDN